MLSSDLGGANKLFASFQAARTKTGPISDFCIHDSRTDWPKVAGMPFVEAAQYMFSRGWGK